MNKCLIPTDPLPFGSTEQEILSVLDQLPIDDQITLLLVNVEGFDHRETSDILGIPVDQIIATLDRTRTLFEKQLTMALASTDGLGSPGTIASRRKAEIRKLLKTAVESIPLPTNFDAIMIARIRSELLGRPANLAFSRSKSERSLSEKFLLLLVMLLFNVIDPIFPGT